MQRRHPNQAVIVLESDKIEELKQKLIQIKPDFLLVVSYGEIIPLPILQIAKHGSVNIHPSMLPLYRGASPLQETLLHGDLETAISWIIMSEKMDAGNIIHQEKAHISEADDYRSLSDRLSDEAAQITGDVLINYSKDHRAKAQNESGATYCKKISKEDGFINVEKETAGQIVAKIKAYSMWPGCYIFWNNKRLKIIKAAVSEQKISSRIVERIDGGLAIGTADGALIILRVQQEGKKEMPIEEFLRGQKEIPKTI